MLTLLKRIHKTMNLKMQKMDTYEKLEILKRLLILALAISIFILLKLQI